MGFGALARSRKGYVFSLFVFLIMAGAFVIAITNMKSVSVLQDSNYERITIMKASNLAKNIAGAVDSGNCPQAQSLISANAAEWPFAVDLNCDDSIVTVTSKSGFVYSAQL